MPSVLLVNMPFSSLRWPNLGLSLLKAALLERGVDCRIAYFNYDFAEQVGLEHYTWLADYFAFVLGGERLFAKYYFPGRLPSDARYFQDVLLSADAGFSGDDRQAYEATPSAIGPFLDRCMAAVDWQQYSIVGFAASFQQTLPSLCLARRIKRLHPRTTIVFGGAACQRPMGVELARQFAEIDYVWQGEADFTFPLVVEQILAGVKVQVPSGVVRRSDLAGPSPRPAGPQESAAGELDALPYPDFDDYFARWRASPWRDEVDPTLCFETSRGCWWGQKHHCLFCGLNGDTMAYRSKSPGRAVEELRWLVDRHGVRRGCSADNIFDFRYFDSFLPQLQASGIGLEFVYEMKTNLARVQVEKLLAAGLGAAQLGIETFSTPLLRRIGKGASALQNLQALKWFSEAGVEIKWNVLYGFPEEDPADYAQLAALIPALTHLAPPTAVGRVRLDRFSPYFSDPGAHGMLNPRANRAFHYVYPFPQDVLDRLAYYYEFDFADGRNPADYAEPLVEAIEDWTERKGTVTLRAYDRPDGVLILHDTRPVARQFQWRLCGWEREVYLHCDTGRSLRAIHEHLQQVGLDVAPQRLEEALAEWLDARIVVFLDDRYLSLALRAPG